MCSHIHHTTGSVWEPTPTGDTASAPTGDMHHTIMDIDVFAHPPHRRVGVGGHVPYGRDTSRPVMMGLGNYPGPIRVGVGYHTDPEAGVTG